jgi:hypothetical protein
MVLDLLNRCQGGGVGLERGVDGCVVLVWGVELVRGVELVWGVELMEGVDVQLRRLDVLHQWLAGLAGLGLWLYRGFGLSNYCGALRAPFGLPCVLPT